MLGALIFIGAFSVKSAHALLITSVSFVDFSGFTIVATGGAMEALEGAPPSAFRLQSAIAYDFTLGEGGGAAESDYELPANHTYRFRLVPSPDYQAGDRVTVTVSFSVSGAIITNPSFIDGNGWTNAGEASFSAYLSSPFDRGDPRPFQYAAEGWYTGLPNEFSASVTKVFDSETMGNIFGNYYFNVRAFTQASVLYKGHDFPMPQGVPDHGTTVILFGGAFLSVILFRGHRGTKCLEG